MRFVGQNVADVKEGISLEADVDKRGIHSGKHVLDDAFEDGADDALFPFHSIFHELAVFEQCDTCLSIGDVDYNFGFRRPLALAVGARGGIGLGAAAATPAPHSCASGHRNLFATSLPVRFMIWVMNMSFNLWVLKRHIHNTK